MRTSASILFLLALILISGCKSKTAEKEVEEFALFTTTEVYDSVSLTFKQIPVVERMITIPENESLEIKITTLLDSVSKNNFHNLKIEVLSIIASPEIGRAHV